MIQSSETQERSIWIRGLLMFVFLILFGLAETLLAILTVFQFFWRVVTGQPNVAVRDFHGKRNRAVPMGCMAQIVSGKLDAPPPEQLAGARLFCHKPNMSFWIITP